MGDVQEIAIQLALNQMRYRLDIKDTVPHLHNKLTQGLSLKFDGWPVSVFANLSEHGQVGNERSYQKKLIKSFIISSWTKINDWCKSNVCYCFSDKLKVSKIRGSGPTPTVTIELVFCDNKEYILLSLWNHNNFMGK